MKFKQVLVELASKTNYGSIHFDRHFNRSRLLACDHENVRPDILILGKALAGGFYPVKISLTKSIVSIVDFSLGVCSFS